MTSRFFIVGSGRCGTKLLRQMLVRHPGIEVCIETHFLPILYDKYGLDEITFEEYFSVAANHYNDVGDRWFDIVLNSEDKSTAGFRDEFTEFCSDMDTGTVAQFTERFHQYLYGGGNRLIGDKTPHYGTAMRELHDLWPDAKFVHLVRDGVFAADSMLTHSAFVKQISHGVQPSQLDRCHYDRELATYEMGMVTLSEAMEFWTDVVDEIEQQQRDIPSDVFYELRYEDLLMRPNRELTDLADFLDIPRDDDWLRDASTHPKPFFLTRTDERVDDDTYRDLVDVHAETMSRYDYPFTEVYDPLREARRSLGYLRRQAPRPAYWKDIARYTRDHVRSMVRDDA